MIVWIEFNLWGEFRCLQDIGFHISKYTYGNIEKLAWITKKYFQALRTFSIQAWCLYSYLSVWAGLLEAALYAWKLMVNKAIANAKREAHK